MLLLRRRRPAVAVATTCAATLGYLAAGYPYGPVLVAVAVGCLGAIVTGHRKAAWWSLGGLWAGHVLVSHWLYRWLPPGGDRAESWPREGLIAAWVVAVVAAAELLRLRREQRAAASTYSRLSATEPGASWSRTPSRRNCCARYGPWSAGTHCSPRA